MFRCLSYLSCLPHLPLVCAVMLMHFPLDSIAHDLGVDARVWAIEEVNLKEVMAAQLQQADHASAALQLKHQVEHLEDRLVAQQLPIAKQTRTHYIDPSVALPQDIVVSGKRIYQRGTWVNPLHWIRPRQDMLFFDGREPAQREFALSALKRFPYQLMLVMTAGKPITLAATIHRPVYYATSALLKRFQIQRTPTLLGVGDGVWRDHLAVVTFAAPYSVAVLSDCWHGCLPITRELTHDNNKNHKNHKNDKKHKNH